jgi:2-polyprenyl-3-methyl-5-hydroxy-6-metoxy-1,4-benzoquinol methylase
MKCSVIEQAVLRRIRLESFSKRAEVLDAPCGSGALASALQEMGFQVHGADLDPAARVFLGDRFRTVDLNGTLPWTDGSFDFVSSIEGIEHLQNPHHFLREIHRVLRTGGRLFLTTPNVASLRSRVRFLGSAFFHKDPLPLNESDPNPFHHINLRPFHLLRYDLHTTGFRIDQVLATHMKPISFAYSILAPWMWAYTTIAFRKERDEAQRMRNREILKAMFSPPVMFGENLLIVARRN